MNKGPCTLLLQRTLRLASVAGCSVYTTQPQLYDSATIFKRILMQLIWQQL
jgi:hypothetical protein